MINFKLWILKSCLVLERDPHDDDDDGGDDDDVLDGIRVQLPLPETNITHTKLEIRRSPSLLSSSNHVFFSGLLGFKLIGDHACQQVWPRPSRIEIE